MIRRRVVVHGRVQGVFFRASTKTQASSRDIAGWVTNRDDGCVEAVFEGPTEDVEGMVAWCRTGPDQARVDEVEVHEEPPTGEQGFRVM